jgi:hypothetical protein
MGSPNAASKKTSVQFSRTQHPHLRQSPRPRTLFVAAGTTAVGSAAHLRTFSAMQSRHETTAASARPWIEQNCTTTKTIAWKSLSRRPWITSTRECVTLPRELLGLATHSIPYARSIGPVRRCVPASHVGNASLVFQKENLV